MLHGMSKLNPRITVTLTPACAAVLRELSGLARNSQSAIVGELLETSLPIFERVVSALRAASSIEASAKREIAAGLDRAQVRLEEQAGLLLSEMDVNMRPLLDAAEKVSRRSGAGGVDREVRGVRIRATKSAVVSASLVTPVSLTGGSGPLKRAKARVSTELVSATKVAAKGKKRGRL